MEQETKLEQYSAIETKIRSVGSELTGKVYDITTGRGLTDAKADRAIWRKLRIGVESIRKETKADVLALGRAIDGEAKRLTTIIVDGGCHVESVVKVEEDRRAAEKAERERMERKRIEDIHDRIDDFKFTLSEYHPVDDLQAKFDELESVTIEDDDDSWGEFKERAKNAMGAAKGECFRALESARERAAKEAVESAERAESDRLAKIKADVQKDKELRLDKERAEFEEKKAGQEKAEREEKALERAEKERADAKCETQALALLKILTICNDPYTDAEKVRLIRIVVEENPAD